MVTASRQLDGVETSIRAPGSSGDVPRSSLRKDDLFENGEKEGVLFDTSSQFVLQDRSHFGPSLDSACCSKILSDLRKIDEECLAFAFHDEISLRRRMSGFHVTSLRRLLFKQWKSFVEERKVLKLRSDGGLKSFSSFLQGLTPVEKEDILPLLVQARKEVEDARIRKKEVRVEKLFTFRSQLDAETSTLKKKKIVNDWLNLGFGRDFSEVEVRNGLFLRENVRIEDEAIRNFFKSKIHELGKTAGVWRHDLGKKISWAKRDEHGLAYYTLDAFDDIWSHVFADVSALQEVGGFFVPCDMLQEMFVFIGASPGDIDDMDSFFDAEGIWMPVSALHPEGLLKILLLLWKCRDGNLVKRETGNFVQRPFMGTLWTNEDSLMVLPSTLAVGGQLQDVFDVFLQEQWIGLGEYMELQSRTFLTQRGMISEPLREEDILPTVSDTLSWTNLLVESDLRENCIGLALRQTSHMMSLIEFSGRRSSEWEPDGGKFVSLRVCDDLFAFCFIDERCGGRNFDFIRETVCGDFHVGVFMGNSPVNGKDPLANHAIYRFVALQQKEPDGGGIITVGNEENRQGGHVIGEQDDGSFSSKKWSRVELGKIDVVHCGLAGMWKEYQFATLADLRRAWGAQVVNVQLRFNKYLGKFDDFEKWEVYLRPDDAEAVCWIHSSWRTRINFQTEYLYSMFGCGLMGLEMDRAILLMPRLSSISVVTAVDGDLPPIIVDLFSGIGGWQWGNSDTSVVSVEKDPAVIAVHAAQTGVGVIDATCIDRIWGLNVDRLPILLNFDVRDRRWWVVFLLFRVLYCTGPPPCVSWSGAAHSAGLDHPEGLLFGETLAMGHALSFPKQAIENVAAILCHRHWRDLKALVESVLNMNLVILKLDLQMFMPLKRLRVFLFIGQDKRTIGPFQECVGSCMSLYGFQHMLCPRLLRSKGLLSVFMRDGRVRAGIRRIDSLEFAWLLGFSGIKWPRCLRTAFRVLGNCVSQIHARIVNGWIQRNWLGLPFDFDLLWNDLRRINDGNMMLADCQFFQDDEWIRWETGGSSGNLRVVDVQKVGISIQTAGKGLFFRVPFHPGLLMHQILSVVYPCDWSKIDILFRNSKTLYSLCNGDFHISVLDVCIMIDGIGWIQVSPLVPLGNIYERVLMQRGIDIRPFQLCIDDGPVDKDVLIAAFLPKNRYYLCDSLNQRFDNFLTPSVKRRRLAAGTFAAQPALVSGNGQVFDGICIDLLHVLTGCQIGIT